MSSKTEVKQEVPELFLSRWRGTEGYDPLEMEEKSRYWGKMFRLSLLLAFAAAVTMAVLGIRHDSSRSTIGWNEWTVVTFGFVFLLFGLLVFSMIAQVKYERYGSKLNNFKSRLGCLAACLRLEEAQLYQFANPTALKTAATVRLKDMARYIVAIEKIPGSESNVTIQGLRSGIQRHHEEFKYWGAVAPDSRVGEYFPYRHLS